MSPYQYANQNPLNFTDPTGLIWWVPVWIFLTENSAAIGMTAMVATEIATGAQTPASAAAAPVKKAAGSAIQYTLRAMEDGFYPVMKRGCKLAQEITWLNRGEVWKYGKTINPGSRYSETYLQSIGPGVRMAEEFRGTPTEALAVEVMKIENHVVQAGVRPPGNKVNR